MSGEGKEIRDPLPSSAGGDIAAYRPDIDGLRAVAVLSVVLCHANLGVPGGFVGVDVFFVISGYLITGLIVRDLRRGTFSMLAFWERRVRRILPALFVVAVATLVSAWFVLFPIPFRLYANTLIALAVGASNIQLWREAGYFEIAARYKPLLHTWSLAVEEQFYLVTPILLGLLWRRMASRRLIAVLVSFAGASLVLSIIGTSRFPGWTFFMLPTRAWELLIGSVLSLVPQLSSNRAREVAAAGGAALIVSACFSYTDQTTFPGLAALPVALGAAAIIWAGAAAAGRRTWVGRFLESRLLVWTGLISYSLYLWHWPVLVFARFFGADSVLQRLVLVGASIVVAALSWAFVERPFRRRTVLAKRTPLFVTAACGLAFLIAVGILIRRGDGFPSRFNEREKRYLDAWLADPRYIHEVDTADVPERLHQLGSPGGAPRILVWGDSHAMALLPAVDSAAAKLGVGALVATHSVTAPAINFVHYDSYGLNDEAIRFNQAVLGRALKGDVKLVILGGMWDLYLRDTRFLPRLQETVTALQAGGVRVAVVLDMPRFRYNVPHRLFLAERFPKAVGSASLDAEELRRQRQPQDDLASNLQGVTIIDPWNVLVRTLADGRFPAEDGTGPLYRDGDHLSTYGSMKLVPLFEETFRKLGLEAEGLPHP